MQKNAELYDFTQTLQGVIYQAGMKHYAEITPEEDQTPAPDYPPIMMIRRGYAESVGWVMVQLYEFHPKPLTVETFRVRAVYSAPRLSQALLELIASEGWANRDGEAYTLTQTGLDFITNLLAHRNEQFKKFCPLGSEKLTTLVKHSHRIFQFAIDNNDAQSIWCLRYSQKRKPQNVSSIAQLIHVCSDFNAWRDDCHMAAYTEHGVNGMTWEAFAHIHNEQAQTASELFDKLTYRGWTVTEWQQALDTLWENGWITKSSELYIATNAGTTIHKAVEDKTNTLFYSAWSALSDNEQIQYNALLHELHDTCMAMLNE